MKQTLTVGKIYRIRLTNGHWTNAEFIDDRNATQHRDHFGHIVWRSNHHFIFRNLATGREIEIKSRVRIKELPEAKVLE